jgi:hypothetical protein
MSMSTPSLTFKKVEFAGNVFDSQNSNDSPAKPTVSQLLGFCLTIKT